MVQIAVKAVVPQIIKSNVFGAAFDKYQHRENVFAIVGGRYAIIAQPHKTEGIKIVSTYVDDHPEEDFFVCAWTRDESTKEPLLAVAGWCGVLKLINTRTQKVVAAFPGHGDEIYDMKVSPVHPYIIATAANDHTIRIWSLDPKRRSQPTIAICGGEGGHREGILTMAFHANPLYMLSGGMDHAVCLWMCPILHNLQVRSSAVPVPDPATIDVPERYSYPHVSTTAIHTDYVDCVDFHNDFILSKSSRENRIVLWHILGFDSQRKYENRESMIQPTTTHEYKETRSAFGDSVVRLMQFDIRNCEPWYMKFGVFSYPLDLLSRVNDKDRATVSQDGKVTPSTYLAMGNSGGNVYVWDLEVFEQDPKKGEQPGKSLSNAFALMKPHNTLGVPKLKQLIRQVAWSTYGDWLVAVGDMGLVCLWQVGKQSD